jgi:hypothetical protein
MSVNKVAEEQFAAFESGEDPIHFGELAEQFPSLRK